ncbi:MAG: neutral/alkaline non-lysosomal ceramidase N-terminal domain-containing protein, partial [Myxococcota bacterium]
MRRRRWLVVLVALAAACGDDSAAVDAATPDDAVDSGGTPDLALTIEPDLVCPGPGCETGDTETLRVGAAAVDITPAFGPETEVLQEDPGGDGLWDRGVDTYNDANGNGVFDGLWIAGFAVGRPASGVSDPQWARAIVIENGDTRIGFVSLDLVGLFYDDVRRIRQRLADMDLDYLGVMTTHSHQSRDTLGQWGPVLGDTGIADAYMEQVSAGAEAAVEQAVAALEPANIDYASTRLRDQPGGVRRYISDSRDPQVIDDEIRLLRFVQAGGEQTIATLVNFGAHPEYAGSRNTLLSSDLAHGLREAIENGTTGPSGELEGVGGIAVFINGAVGSQIGPNDLDAPVRFNGEAFEGRTLELAHGVGAQLGAFSLQALRSATREQSAHLSLRVAVLEVAAENTFFHIAFESGVFPTRQPLNPDERYTRFNPPRIETEVAVIDVGRARLLLVPGELDPALFVGGYDGAFAPMDRPVVDESAAVPPDLSRAPGGPYLRERAALRADGEAEYVFLFGLANDELGYFIPSFDFVLSP